MFTFIIYEWTPSVGCWCWETFDPPGRPPRRFACFGAAARDFFSDGFDLDRGGGRRVRFESDHPDNNEQTRVYGYGVNFGRKFKFVRLDL